jgi:hypothetical protein
VLREQEQAHARLRRELEAEQARAATPAGLSWKDFRGLAGALAKAPDPFEARVRLRAALRRAVAGVWLLVTRKGKDAVCVAQVFFHGGLVRGYVIYQRQKRNGFGGPKPAASRARSLAGLLGEADVDLRRREDALALEEELQARDWAGLWAALG